MAATRRSPRLRLISSPSLEPTPAVESAEARDAPLDSEVVAVAQPEVAPPAPHEQEQAEVDVQLVGRALRAEPAAFEALYRRHAEFAFNLAVRIQGSSSDVEDVVHDAFLKAQERLDDLRDCAAFRPWLGSIVVRLVRTRLRRRKLLGALGLTAPEPVEIDTIAAADADPEARALLAQVYALLQTLSADDRIAWTLRYVERHRLETVAVMMDCSLATAKRRIGRAQRFLTEHFVAPFGSSSS
jgi:RNA polymerase sigma-70 factor (ECF subfamily)